MDALGKQFWLVVLSFLTFPSQGAFFFLVFIRPTYLQIRRNQEGASPVGGRLCALWMAIWGSKPFPSPGAGSAETFSAEQEQDRADDKEESAATEFAASSTAALDTNSKQQVDSSVADNEQSPETAPPSDTAQQEK